MSVSALTRYSLRPLVIDRFATPREREREREEGTGEREKDQRCPRALKTIHFAKRFSHHRHVTSMPRLLFRRRKKDVIPDTLSLEPLVRRRTSAVCLLPFRRESKRRSDRRGVPVQIRGLCLRPYYHNEKKEEKKRRFS